jgi:hypothetical protein
MRVEVPLLWLTFFLLVVDDADDDVGVVDDNDLVGR